MANEIEDTIQENAKGPKRAKGDSGEIEQHSLTEQIEVARFSASTAAVKKKPFGLRRAKMIPPGAD
jgi:hypothetical protein